MSLLALPDVELVQSLPIERVGQRVEQRHRRLVAAHELGHASATLWRHPPGVTVHIRNRGEFFEVESPHPPTTCEQFVDDMLSGVIA
jgi:hypothetical protein